MNRPYKSTSLDDLTIICSNVPNREVLKAILTELSHRQTKQARKLEAILVQHLAKQSGDNTVNSLETTARKNQSNLADYVEPIDTSGEIKGSSLDKPRWNTNPKQSKHPLTDEHQTAVTEFVSGDSLKITAVAGAGKTNTLAEKANARDGLDPYLAFNRTIADEASIEMRDATESKQKFEKPRSYIAQSKVSRTRKKPNTKWVSWKQVLLKTAVYICGLIIVAAIIGYSYFPYSDWIQTATNLDEYQESPETYNKVQNGRESPDRGDFAQDFQKGLKAPDNGDLVQDFQKSLKAPDNGDLVQDFQRGLDASDKGDLAQDIQKGLDAYKKGDYPTALQEFRALSEQGNADAQYNLGLLFDKGQGVLEDYEEAAKWYRKSAEQGNGDAQLILGISYYEGEDVPEDYEEAEKWYRKSAEQGNGDAQNRLGFMYEKGLGVIQDYTEAAKWYRKSAEQGNANAQKNLSARYFLGQGVIQDNVYAHMWVNIAASQGHKAAIKIGDLVAKKMNASDISKAKELARECVRKNYKGC